MAFRMMIDSAIPRRMTAARYMLASVGLMKKDIAMAHSMVAGARIAMRRIIWYAFWMLVTSVVSRVTSPAVLNLSMLEKAYVCMFSNIAFRRFLPSPIEALEPNFAPIHPEKSDKRAARIIHAPMIKMWWVSPLFTPSSMMDAIKRGMMVSSATSMSMKIGVAMEAALYSLTWAPSVFNIESLLSII